MTQQFIKKIKSKLKTFKNYFLCFYRKVKERYYTTDYKFRSEFTIY